MPAELYETESVIDVTDEWPVRLCRMTFTADELLELADLLIEKDRLIAIHFYRAWVETSMRISFGED